MAMVQDMLNQVRLVKIGKHDPVHHPLHIRHRQFVGRQHQAVRIFML